MRHLIELDLHIFFFLWENWPWQGKGGEEGVKHFLGVQKVPNLYVTSIHHKDFFDGEGFKCQTNARIHIHHFVIVGFNSPLG